MPNFPSFQLYFYDLFSFISPSAKALLPFLLAVFLWLLSLSSDLFSMPTFPSFQLYSYDVFIFSTYHGHFMRRRDDGGSSLCRARLPGTNFLWVSKHDSHTPRSPLPILGNALVSYSRTLVGGTSGPARRPRWLELCPFSSFSSVHASSLR